VRVAVLGGGRSGEHEVSLASAASVAEGLREAGHEVVRVDLLRDGTWRWAEGEVVLRAGGGLLDCDVAWPVLHGPYGEDGTVQGLLEILDIPYVGSPVLGSALCMDKLLLKDVMAAHGVPQVAYAAARAPEDPVDVGWPCWVKPSRLGSSVGISRVDGPQALPAAIEAALSWDERVIVEAHASGLEVEVSVLGDRVSEPGEIVLTAGDGWYDYEAKYTPGGMELQVPARISEAARDELREVALRAFRLAGCRGLARVDFFVDGDRVLLNELNTMPGFTPTSVYAKLWAADGVAYPEVCDELVALAVTRRATAR
jgi:D-alanine-D-alanine ligase